MALTRKQREALEFIIKRLRKDRLGCAAPFPGPDASAERQANGYEGVSRIYVDTWLIGPLQLLLSDDSNDHSLARDMAR